MEFHLGNIPIRGIARICIIIQWNKSNQETVIADMTHRLWERERERKKIHFSIKLCSAFIRKNRFWSGAMCVIGDNCNYLLLLATDLCRKQTKWMAFHSERHRQEWIWFLSWKNVNSTSYCVTSIYAVKIITYIAKAFAKPSTFFQM